MTNPIKEIYRFNKEAGLLEKGYDDKRECAYPIEEMFEGFSEIEKIFYSNGPTISPKEASRYIMEKVNLGNPISDVDRFDKHLDAIVFNFGSLFKLGLTPQQAIKGLSVVMQANMQKLKVGQDDQGKQLKPEDFIGPEKQLQKILNERK